MGINREKLKDIPLDEYDWEEWESMALNLASMYWQRPTEDFEIKERFMNKDEELVWVIETPTRRMTVFAVTKKAGCKTEFFVQRKKGDNFSIVKPTQMIADAISCQTPRQKKAGVLAWVYKVKEVSYDTSTRIVITLVITKNKKGKFYVSGRYFYMKWNLTEQKWIVARKNSSSTLYGEYETREEATEKVDILILKRGVRHLSNEAICFAAHTMKGEITEYPF